VKYHVQKIAMLKNRVKHAAMQDFAAQNTVVEKTQIFVQ